MSVQSAERSTRFAGFDYLRVAGVLAVISIHGFDSNAIARSGTKWLGFAVPCFFMTSAFLTQLTILRKDVGYVDTIKNKFRRLAPAYFAWSAVYMIARTAKAFATNASVDSSPVGIVFWGDASYQLYFVPMLFYNFVLWTGFMLLARNYRSAAIVGLIVMLCTCIATEPTVERMLPPDRWFVAKNLVWFPIGIFFAMITDRLGERRTMLFWPSLLLLCLMVGIGIANVYAVSITVFSIAISVTKSPPSWLTVLSALSFVIYLSHVLILESLQFAANRFNFPPSAFSTTIVITAFTFAMTLTLCCLLGRSSWTRWSVA